MFNFIKFGKTISILEGEHASSFNIYRANFHNIFNAGSYNMVYIKDRNTWF